MLKYYLNTLTKNVLSKGYHESAGMNNIVNLDNRLSLRNMIKILREYQKIDSSYCLFKFNKESFSSELVYK